MAGAPVEFAVNVAHEDEHVVLRVAGELDLATAPQFRDAGLRALGIEPTTIVIDLGGVTFMDSTGLGVLVLLRRKARARRSALRLVPGPRTEALLQVTGLIGAFDLYPDADSALSA